VDASELIVAEVWKNKILQEYHVDSRVNFGASDDVWAWHVPGKGKQGKEKTTMEVQLINHYMLDTRHYRAYGYPTFFFITCKQD